MPGARDYEVFGFRVRSDVELPELFPAEGNGEPDVFIRSAAIGVPPSKPGLEPAEGGLLLTIADVGRFLIREGRSIVVEPHDTIDARNIRLFLFGSAFGVLLHQRGLLPLHANAVEVDGKAVAFMGASGAGKSTLAAWFHDRGHRVLADDVCVVRFDEQGKAFACSGLPRLRLWAEVLELMGRDLADYERSYIGEHEQMEKFDVPIKADDEARGDTPIHAIYLLDRGDTFSVTRLKGMNAADAVFANTYRGEYLSVTSGQKEHWESAVRLVRGTPVFRATRHWDPASREEQCVRLLDHARWLLRKGEAD